MNTPVHLAIVWHMHQPFYKELVSNRYILPWVRLHGTKDYYDMVRLLADYPNVRQTFNLVPSLLVQIQEYADGVADDRFIELTLQPPEALTDADKVEILTTFFFANPEHMIHPHPRYRDLYTKRGEDDDPERLARSARYFSDQDFSDLQVWFNLAWCDPLFQREDKVIRELIEKGRDFTQEDKVALIDRHRAILGMIIPEYRAARERGQAELTTTPFYHPILPLLCDTESAKEALPHHPLPRRFSHPEDARTQIARAVAHHTELFGAPPRGMWPSEGSVSEAVIPLIAEAGIEWIATDEGVLRQSLQMAASTAGDHFRPYRLDRGRHQLSILFRDHRLSDRVGFVYSKQDPQHAAADLIETVKRIGRNLQSTGRPPLVPIILDGENCWEYYPGDGHEFLHALYGRLNDDPEIVSTTVSDYLDAHPAEDNLPRLFAGSWINHDFEIWIGREEDNNAWERLHDARDTLTEFAATTPDAVEPDRLKRAWEALYIAEGSDWCWWYGGQHAGMLAAFDALFRQHLKTIYELIGKPIPAILDVPILRHKKQVEPTLPEVALIYPEIDGEVGSYFEWLSAAVFEVSGEGGGAMHAGEQLVSRLYYGFDPSNLYLRLDFLPELEEPNLATLAFEVRVLAPTEDRFTVRVNGGKAMATHQVQDGDGNWSEAPFTGRAAFREVLEMAVPFADSGWSPGDEVHLFVRVRDGEEERERWPGQGYLAVTLPSEDYEVQNWYV